MMKLFLLWGLSLTLAAGPDPDAMRRLYQEGVSQFNQQQYQPARQSFEKLLPWLQASQQQRKPATKDWHLMTLGQCDVYYFLGAIAESQQSPRLACRYYQKVAKQLKSVPEIWKTWSVNPNLPTHLGKATSRWTTFCPTVPSIIEVRVIPAAAKVTMLQQGKWVPVQAKSIKTTKRFIQLTISAPGFVTKELTKVPVPRWQTTKRTIQLTKKKVVVAVVRRPPPKVIAPTPVYKKPWFWAVIGVGAVGIGVGVGLTAAYLNRGTTFGCGDGALKLGGCGP